MRRDFEDAKEDGQVIVIMVIALVILIAFIGLAVDGSLIYSERRVTQSLADAAALNAARALCQDEDYEQAVNDILSQNGFEVDNESKFVTINNPPSNPKFENNPEYIEVIVKAVSPPSLIMTVFEGDLSVTSKAVARCTTSQSGGGFPGGDYSLIALRKNGDNGFYIHGSGQITTDGGVFTNASGSEALTITGRSFLTAGLVSVFGGCKVTGSSHIYSTVVQINEDCRITGTSGISPFPPLTGVSQIDDPYLSIPLPEYPATPEDYIEQYGGVCEEKMFDWQNYTIGPGCYTKIDKGGNGYLLLLPGDYYIYGGGLKVHGSVNLLMDAGVRLFMIGGNLNWQGSGKIEAPDIFMFFTDGIFEHGGSPDVIMTAPGEGDPWHGMLMFLDRSNTSLLDIHGAVNTRLTGTIYAPSSSVTIRGSGSITAPHTLQIIAQDFDVGGEGDIFLHYDGNYFYEPPSSGKTIELVE